MRHATRCALRRSCRSSRVEFLENRTLLAAVPQLYEAESATITGATVGHSHPGYTGTGYVDYQHATGDSIQWSVNAMSAGQHGLTFRYANGGAANRTLDLTLGGAFYRQVTFAPTGSWNTWRTVSVRLPLAAGANIVALRAAGTSGPNVDSLSVRTAVDAYEAEDAAISGAIVARAHVGYTGTGYVDCQHAAGDFVDWTVFADAAGQAGLEVRYANKGADRPLALSVNGAAQPMAHFAPTGSWDRWSTVTVPVTLVAGENHVRLTAAGASGPNVDSLTVRAGPPGPAPGINLTAGVLTVVGGAANDVILVDAAGGNIIAALNGASSSFPATSVQRVEILGGDGNDSVTGGPGAPALVIHGGAGDDDLHGGPGDDVIDGGAGNDNVDGGGGADTADYSARTNRVTVNLEDEVIVADILTRVRGAGGEAGEADAYLNVENVTGGAGDDTLLGNAYRNALSGGGGNDRLLGNDGDDTLLGGPGDDFFNGQVGNDVFDPGTGTNSVADPFDAVVLSAGVLTATGTPADETISLSRTGTTLTLRRTGRPDLTFPAASVTAAWIDGIGGDDTLRLGNADGSAAPNIPATLFGGDGRDTLVGGPANDQLNGGAGADVMDGGMGADVFNGESDYDPFGNQNVIDYSKRTNPVFAFLHGRLNERDDDGWGLYTPGGEAGENDAIRFDNLVVVGGSGNDHFQGLAETSLYGGPGDDVLEQWFVADDVQVTNINLYGGPGNDELHSEENASGMLFGEEGDDTFHAQDRSGTTFNGGPGYDKLFADGFTDYGFEFNAEGTGIEEVHGTEFGDTLTGSAGADLLDGDQGNDTIDGRGGDDTLHGGAGNDTVQGGDGNDTLNGDEQFQSGADQLLGGNGNDTVFARDGVIDLVDGGPGTDSGQLDATDQRQSIENLLA